MGMNHDARINCRRWYCKNTINTYGVTGGYCVRCTRAKQNLGWFFNLQPAIRILSWPFLFIGGIGLGTQIIALFRPESVANPGRALLALVAAGAIFCIGLALRWSSAVTSFVEMSAEAKGLSGGFKWSGRKRPLEGSTCPELRFYDKRGNLVTPTDFKNKIVVVKTWAGTNADIVDRGKWRNFDDARMVFLYVYIGQEAKRFQEEPIPKWQKAASYLLYDSDHDVERKLGTIDPIFRPDYFILDREGIIRRIRPIGIKEYDDTHEVKKLLWQIPVQPVNPDTEVKKLL